MGEGGEEEVRSGCGGGGVKQIACLSTIVGILNFSFTYMWLVRKLVKSILKKHIHINDHKLYRGLFLKISMSVSKTIPLFT